MKLSRPVLCCVFMLAGCVSGNASVFVVSPVPVSKKAEQATPGRFAMIRFLGFTHLPEEERVIRSALGGNAATMSGGSALPRDGDIELDVILESERPGRSPAAATLHILASVLTATIIPYRNPVNYRLTYRSTRAGVPLAACTFTLLTNEWISILTLPLTPFFWPRDQRVAGVRRTALQFLGGCTSAWR